MIRRHPVPALFAGLFLLYVLTANVGLLQPNDVAAASLQAWSLGQHGSLWLDHFAGRPNLWLVVGSHGHVLTNRFPGAVLWGALFYFLAPHGGFTLDPQAQAAAAAAAGAVTFVYLTLRETCRRWAMLGALAFGLGTGVWSVAASGLWQHAPAMLAISAGTYAAVRGRWLLCGLGLGAAVLARPHLGLAVAAFGLVLLVAGRRRAFALIAAGAVPGVAGYLAYQWVAYGHPTLSGGYAADRLGMSAGGLLVNVVGVLVSPGRGLLVYSPVLIFAALGLRRAWSTADPVLRAGGVAGLVYLASQLALIRFSGGDGFPSYRVPLEALTYAAPLLVSAVVAARPSAQLVRWSLLWAVGIQAVCAVQPHDVGIFSMWFSFPPALFALEGPALSGLALAAVALVAVLSRRPRPAAVPAVA